MDCSKIDINIKPLFENRLSEDESIYLKNHLLSCRQCYSKLSEEQKISLELYKLPHKNFDLNTLNIIHSLKKEASFKIITYKKPRKRINTDYARVALYACFIIITVFLAFNIKSHPSNTNITTHKPGKFIAGNSMHINPNIKKIEKIQVINEIMPSYKESNLIKNVSAEDFF